MGEFEVWMYRGLIVLMLLVIWWGVQTFAKKIDDNFKELIFSVNEQSKALVKQTTEVENLTKRVDSHDKRLEDHAKRIRGIELKKMES